MASHPCFAIQMPPLPCLIFPFVWTVDPCTQRHLEKHNNLPQDWTPVIEFVEAQDPTGIYICFHMSSTAITICIMKQRWHLDKIWWITLKMRRVKVGEKIYSKAVAPEKWNEPPESGLMYANIRGISSNLFFGACKGERQQRLGERRNRGMSEKGVIERTKIWGNQAWT